MLVCGQSMLFRIDCYFDHCESKPCPHMCSSSGNANVMFLHLPGNTFGTTICCFNLLLDSHVYLVLQAISKQIFEYTKRL